MHDVSIQGNEKRLSCATGLGSRESRTILNRCPVPIVRTGLMLKLMKKLKGGTNY